MAFVDVTLLTTYSDGRGLRIFSFSTHAGSITLRGFVLISGKARTCIRPAFRLCKVRALSGRTRIIDNTNVEVCSDGGGLVCSLGIKRGRCNILSAEASPLRKRLVKPILGDRRVRIKGAVCIRFMCRGSSLRIERRMRMILNGGWILRFSTGKEGNNWGKSSYISW